VQEPPGEERERYERRNENERLDPPTQKFFLRSIPAYRCATWSA
jgi:hypothetical protein